MINNIDCDISYLKPITYDELFDEKNKKCVDYNTVCYKLQEARDSYFGLTSSINNFILDCTKLQKKIREDISGNSLNSLSYEYATLINALKQSSAISLRKRTNNDKTVLVNFEIPATQKSKTISDLQTLHPTDIVYSGSNGVDTVIATIPSVMLYLNTNMALEIKISNIDSVCYDSLTYNNSYIKSYKSKNIQTFVKTLTPPLNLIERSTDFYGFETSEHANNIIDDIINYDLEIPSFKHDIKEILERINTIISYIENMHRSVAQKVKIEKISNSNSN